MKKIFLMVILFQVHAVSAYAQEPVIYYDGRPLEVHVAVGRITEVIFPKKVARIIKGGAADGILIEVMDNSILLLPKNDTPPDIFVTNLTGDNYPLRLSFTGEYHAKVRVVEAFTDAAAKKGNNLALDLMKMMMQGRVPIQATVIASAKKRLVANGMLELTVNTILELPRIKGLLLTAENLSDNSLVVALQNISYPGLIAIASERDTLEAKGKPGSQTRVYMVIRQ